MSKAILKSIRPQHVVNILNDKKTIELDKRLPKDFVGWVYIYCTKAKPKILVNHGVNAIANGKVVARFWFDEYDTVEYITDFDFEGYEDGLNELLCLNDEQISNYGKGKDLYAWHIKNLEIFDKPMALSDFRKIGRDKIMGKELLNVWGEVKRAPQSWQYVYTKK